MLRRSQHLSSLLLAGNGLLAPTMVLRAPSRNASAKKVTKKAKPEKVMSGKKSAKVTLPSPSISIVIPTTSTAQVPPSTAAPSLAPYVSTKLHQEVSKVIPPSANLQVLIGANIAEAQSRLLPTILVKKGLEEYSYHLCTAPMSIETVAQADAFIVLVMSKLVPWAASDRGSHIAEGVSSPSSAPFKPLRTSGFDDNDDVDETLRIARSFGAEGKAAFGSTWGTSKSAAHPRIGGSRVLAKVLLDGESLPAISPPQTDESILHSGTPESTGLLSKLPESAVAVIGSNYPCNAYYFRGENIQVSQNKRGSVLYKQIRHIRNALGSSSSSGFVAVKIFPWAAYHNHLREILRGHTMSPMPASYPTPAEGKAPVAVSIEDATPHPLDPDAFVVTVELFTADVMESGNLAKNAQYPALAIPKMNLLSRGSTLHSTEISQREAQLSSSKAMAKANIDDTPIVDRTKMWVSSNKRHFVRFADAQHGPVGVLREMLCTLIEAFDIGTSETFTEEGSLVRKLDSNINYRLAKNFAEITARHYLGLTMDIDSTFMSSQSAYVSDIKVNLCGNYLLGSDGEPIRPQTSSRSAEYAQQSSGEGNSEDPWGQPTQRTFNGGRSEEQSLTELGLDNIFSPLSGFPPVTVGVGLGTNKKEAADPGLTMFLRRNFYREVFNGAEEGDEPQLATVTQEGLAHAVMVERLAATFAPTPLLLGIKNGCAASRFREVALRNGLQTPNADYLVSRLTPYLTELELKDQIIKGKSNEGSTGGKISANHQGWGAEERAIHSLRTALSSREGPYHKCGFSIHSTVSTVSVEVPLTVAETAHDGGVVHRIERALWRSEVIIKNIDNTVIGTGTGLRRSASKNAAVVDALSKIAPEVALRFQPSTHYVDEVDADSNTFPTQQPEELDEAFEPLTDQLLEGDDTNVANHQQAGELSTVPPTPITPPPVANDGWSAVLGDDDQPPPMHVFTPATSMVSMFRRALQMQIEAYLAGAPPSDSTLEPIQQLKGMDSDEDMLIEELITEEDYSIVELSESLQLETQEATKSPKQFRCSVYATRQGDDHRILLATSRAFNSPPVARLNALSTAYHGLVHDIALLDETAQRLGGGASPKYSLRGPTLQSLCDVCVYYLGLRATSVRSGTVTEDGRSVTCANVFVPSVPKDLAPPKDGQSPTPYNWALSSVIHQDPHNAQRMATLAAIKELSLASRPSGVVPRTEPKEEATQPKEEKPLQLPPVAFTVTLGPRAKGYLAKVLTLLSTEERNALEVTARRAGAEVQTSSTVEVMTIVVGGVADPTRLSLLWCDTIGTQPNAATVREARRYATILDDTLRALRAGTAVTPLPAGHEESDPVQPSVANEAASNVYGAMDTLAPITMALHRFDPSAVQSRDGGGQSILPPPSAAGLAVQGALAAVDALIDAVVRQRTLQAAAIMGDEVGASVGALLARKVQALRTDCLHTTDVRQATQTFSEFAGNEAQSAALAAAGTKAEVIPASSSILGPRHEFNKGKHLKYQQHLERFVLMLFGKQLDVFYSRPANAAIEGGTSPSSYQSDATHFEPMREGHMNASNSSTVASNSHKVVVHNWYCVLGLETLGEEQHARVSQMAPSMAGRHLLYSDGNDDLPSALIIGDLADRAEHYMPSNGDDEDTLRKGFGGTVSQMRPGFVVLGFGSGGSKKEAHAAAAMHAMQWHFPTQLQELTRRGVRW